MAAFSPQLSKASPEPARYWVAFTTSLDNSLKPERSTKKRCIFQPADPQALLNLAQLKNLPRAIPERRGLLHLAARSIAG
ncbi:hypothetical protein IFO70_15610 [Phormidium tenue FACHB-886]|nr:hypothetical protein [Phormidium tenue FACHB-886]